VTTARPSPSTALWSADAVNSTMRGLLTGCAFAGGATSITPTPSKAAHRAIRKAESRGDRGDLVPVLFFCTSHLPCCPVVERTTCGVKGGARRRPVPHPGQPGCNSFNTKPLRSMNHTQTGWPGDAIRLPITVLSHEERHRIKVARRCDCGTRRESETRRFSAVRLTCFCLRRPFPGSTVRFAQSMGVVAAGTLAADVSGLRHVS
jgi:hypothetical protein